jgi:threonine/homoserine/homoserine lactone efflux protein
LAAFWEGVLAGYGIAIPVGAIGVLIIDTSLRKGFRFGFMAGAGTATADLLYAGLAVIAGAALAIALAPFATGLRFASALLLLALGGHGLWRARRMALQPESKTESLGGHGLPRTYGQFLALTLLNPLTVAYFGALILGRDAAASSFGPTEGVAFVLGAALASLSWQTFLAAGGAAGRRYLSPQFRIYATVAGNLIVIALGIRILFQLPS